ncbi:SusC/RagA family TonB-linked outer membrane protein [Bacteroides oleiciplenus]|uniref:SusC/RagA family TonB-linked outer membrane protein n=1 Tax=Bacteroides oleiciplenus TaxID=626931 RepID=UPI0026DC95B9|nr:TonB-dependent receptor [Bacteroides oleiciplenus]
MKRVILLLGFLVTVINVQSLYAQNFSVKGRVVSDEGNEPLIGVAIMQEGNGNGVITDIDGNYTIEIKGADRATLTFSYVGMQQQQHVVTPATRTLDIVLKSDAQVMDEVVVVAYGVRKKGTIAGSVSTVKSEKLADVPAASFDQALQGQAPGLTVLARSGEPSAPASFSIRGTNSINSGTSPLFIMDGMPISGSDFNAINPSDIESVSVLKDASSTSIYGARAANGVIVITTKRGSLVNQSAKVTFRTQLGISQLAQDNWNLMNTAERIAYEKEVGLDAGKDYGKLGLIDINWFDEVFNNSALLQSYELQVNGATDKVRYYVSGNFYNQDGVAVESYFKRYNVRANVEAQAKEWLKIGTNIMMTHENIQQADQGAYSTVTPISAARFMLPYWNPYKNDGSLASVNDGSWKGLNQNPLEWIENNPATSDKNKLIANLFFEFTPVKGLKIRSLAGLNYTDIDGVTYSMPSYRPNNDQGKAARSNSRVYNFSITNTAEYRFNIDRIHDFNFMIGQEGVDYKSEGFSVATAGQNNDKLTDISTGTRATSWANSSSAYSYVSFFGRGEYNYDNRYYADFSLRTDGSSRFGVEGRWATFWSVGLMWNLLGEKFMRNNKWLTNAQIAFSMGTSGNSEIPNYDHLALVAGGGDYMDNAGIAPVSKGNEKLKWEKLWTTNIALHLGFFDRINMDVEFYNKKTTNMLMAVPVSYADAGYGSRWDNVGGMINRGVELNIGVDVVKTNNFIWNVNANASYNKNEITELYNGVQEYIMSTTGMKLAVGHSYGEFYLNRYAGVNPANGDPLWYDMNGEITPEFHESDKVLVGHSYIAPWQGGFGTTLSWKGLSLGAQFSWVADRWMMNNDRFFEENTTFDNYNLSRRMLYDRWKQPGDVTAVPRYGVTPQFDTHLLENASFLRLKNLSLGYTLPASLLKRTKVLSAARVYAQAQNLFTFTDFSGLDPESNSNIYKAQYPMTRQFTFGLEFTF